MSLQAINYAMTQPVEETGPRLLLFIIAHHVNWETGMMYVKQEQLAEEIRASERSVRRWLDTLEADGYITRKECRGENGHRLPDEIDLIGYLDWQKVLYEGGTIRSPKTRGKPVSEQPAKLSGSDADNRTLLSGIEQRDQPAKLSGINRPNEGVQPDKTGGPTGHLCPVHNNHLQPLSSTLSARPGACEAGASPGRASAGGPPRSGAQPLLVVKQGDASWGNWMAALSAAAAEKAERHGSIEVTGRWPERPGARFVRVMPADGVAA